VLISAVVAGVAVAARVAVPEASRAAE